MANAYFEALNIKFELPPMTKYHDEGFVDSIPETINLVYLRHLNPKKARQINKGKYTGVKGYHAVVKGVLGCEHHHIFYLDQGSKIENIGVRAREETHVLQRLADGEIKRYYISRTIDMIAERFPGVKEIDPFKDNKKNDRMIAEICGAYAVMRDYSHLPRLDPEFQDDIKDLFA